jgi:hypothetical protein
MTFCRQMHDRIRIETGKDLAKGRTIADICATEPISSMSLDGFKRCKIAGIGQLIDDNDLMIGLSDEMPDQS